MTMLPRQITENLLPLAQWLGRAAGSLERAPREAMPIARGGSLFGLSEKASGEAWRDLHMLIQSTPLHEFQSALSEAQDYFGFEINALLPATGQTLLHHAVIRAWAEKEKSDSSAPEDWPDMVAALLDAGADPNIPNRYGFTAGELCIVHLAVMSLHEMLKRRPTRRAGRPVTRVPLRPSVRMGDLLNQWKNMPLSEDQRNDLALIDTLLHSRFRAA